MQGGGDGADPRAGSCHCSGQGEHQGVGGNMAMQSSVRPSHSPHFNTLPRHLLIPAPLLQASNIRSISNSNPHTPHFHILCRLPPIPAPLHRPATSAPSASTTLQRPFKSSSQASAGRHWQALRHLQGTLAHSECAALGSWQASRHSRESLAHSECVALGSWQALRHSQGTLARSRHGFANPAYVCK